MFTAIFTHQVQDFDKWLTLFESHAEIRAKFGGRNAEVFQAQDDPNKVTVMARFESFDMFQQFVASDDLKQAMEKGGVMGPPDVLMLNSVKAYDN